MGNRLRVWRGSLIGDSLIAWVSLGGCFFFFFFLFRLLVVMRLWVCDFVVILDGCFSFSFCGC